jgi:hypothetical protein
MRSEVSKLLVDKPVKTSEELKHQIKKTQNCSSDFLGDAQVSGRTSELTSHRKIEGTLKCLQIENDSLKS